MILLLVCFEGDQMEECDDNACVTVGEQTEELDAAGCVY